MRRSILTVLLVAAALLVPSGCTIPGGAPGTSSSTTASASRRPSGNSTPRIDLTLPGTAQLAIEELTALAAGRPIIRLTITREMATVAFTEAAKARSFSWTDGRIEELDSDVAHINQASFDPQAFALNDIGALFRQAGETAGSTSHQELQINEVNEGRVLMTVTTDPESATIFFRADGSMINHLDFTTTEGIAEALRDTVDEATTVLGIGLRPEQGMWVDVAAGPGVIERRIRPAKLPAYSTQRNQASSLEPFSPALAKPEVIATLLRVLPTRLNEPPDSRVEFVMDTKEKWPGPTLRFAVGTTLVITAPDGTDITDRVR